jgi:16S rRNA C967 or C1407 C5-methylase (RsmB/RsmF family)
MDRFGYEFNVFNGDYEMMQILPDAEGSEGFFYALMRKN